MNEDEVRAHRWNNLKHAALLLVGLAVLLMAIGWVLAGPPGLLWAAVLGAAALLFSPRISPGLILRMYKARPLGRPEAPTLFDAVEALAARAGLDQAPALFYVPSPIMNAFSVGRREDAVVAVTDGLLRGLPPRELTAVLAHELSHIRHDDMWIMSLADSASRIVRGLSLVGQILILVNLPVILLSDMGMPWLPLLLLMFAPTLSALLQLALSRNREFDADVEAVRMTGDPAGLAQALQTLESQQERLWQHIFWPGFRNRQPSLLRTHPNTEARIERLKSLVPEGRPGVSPPAQGFAAGPWTWGGEPPSQPRPRHRWHGLWY